jgi:hypothetical protein
MKSFVLFLIACTLSACAGLPDGQSEQPLIRPPGGPGPAPNPPVTIPWGQPQLIAGFRHALGARAYLMETSGSLRQLDFDPSLARGGERQIDKFSGYTALAAFDTRTGGQQHLVVVDGNGDVFHVTEDDYGTYTKIQLGHFDHVVAVAAYYPENDVFYHAYVVQSSGWLSQLYFTDVGLAGIDANVTNVGPVSSMVGFYNANDLAIRSHLLLLNNWGLWDFHFDPVWGRKAGPTFLADYVGRYAGAFSVTGWVSYSGQSHLAVVGGDGVVHTQDWTPSGFAPGPDLGVVPGGANLLGLDTAFTSTTTTIYGLTNDSRLHRLYGGTDNVVAAYDTKGGDPVSVIPELSGLPDMQIEIDTCLTPTQRASLAASANASLGNLSNAQAKQYFSHAVFYSDCYANHREKGGIWRIDITKPSRDLAMAPQQILDSGNDYAFDMKAWTLQDLTQMVWKTINKDQGTITLNGYSLNLDSANHDTVDLHVDANWSIFPSGADYTDHLFIDGSDTFQCTSGHSYGAPDEPSVGCLAAGAFPKTATLFAAPQQLHYHKVNVDSAHGVFAEGTFY